MHITAHLFVFILGAIAKGKPLFLNAPFFGINKYYVATTTTRISAGKIVIHVCVYVCVDKFIHRT
jgi:hypothetical protein